ncbi:MAG TPA: 4-hydroxyphenylacetate 3-monooxygenase, oxygenase component [Nitrososphaerales archaeon]|nr:4-hydroxyphenylacetate 3-monooxygenase, oxygenase component [Nitrososphaerales archaeon]
MGARTGKQYLHALDTKPREIWLGGRKVSGSISSHPKFKAMAKSMANLYDMQHKSELLDVMTYISPSSGERVGMSFLQPKTIDDVRRRGRMMKLWADYSGGMVGRTPDYLNSDLMAMSAASEFFGKKDARFGSNIRKYYEYIRENDLLMTHTLIHPQANRSVGPGKQSDPFLAARVAEKNDEGVVIRGARMLATLPLADEILVFPSTVIRGSPDDMPYAFAFGIPLSTKGLRFICRESFAEDSSYDHPLASRFDEQDAVVIFDNVLVPWERMFLLEDVEGANTLQEASSGIVFMSHQVAVKNVAKTEFILGVVSLIVDTIGIDQFQHVQEKVAEVIITLESMKAFLRASEADSKINKWGIMTPDFAPLNAARNLYPKLYPRLREIIQQLCASGLMALPTEADMNSDLREDIDAYYQARNTTADEKIRLFRLAWEIAGSSFGSRQELYERFFFGDPVRMAGALYNWYDKEPYKRKIIEFLHKDEKDEST